MDKRHSTRRRDLRPSERRSILGRTRKESEKRAASHSMTSSA
jgi:hypothetical protein